MIEVEGCDVKLYRHCDGYPEGPHGVLATLIPQVKKFIYLRGFYEPEYLLARIAQWQMNGRDLNDVLGFGLDTSYHDDLEYIYRVRVNGIIEIWHSEMGERTKLSDAVKWN